MRNIIAATVAASVLFLTAVDTTWALPAVAPGAGATSDAQSDLQDSRVFCYNRYSGRFLHWGSCGYRRVWYRPRIYCRNVYTGRFLHWGHC